MSRKLTLSAVAALASMALVDSVAASQGMVPVGVPDWAVYVGLAVLCPEDINEMIRERVDSGGGD